MSLKVVYFIYFLDFVQLSLVLPLINPHVISLGGSLTLVGLLTSLASGVHLFASPVIGSWSDTRGRRSLLLFTISGTLISNFLTGFESLQIFFFARIFYGMVHQTEPLMKALIADRVPQNEQTAAFNKLMIFSCMSFMFGPILGGLLYELFHSFQVITACLCTIDLIILGTIFLYLDEKPKETTDKDKDAKKEKQPEQEKTFLQNLCNDLSKAFSNLKNVDRKKYGDLLYVKFYVEAAFNFLFMNMGLVLRQYFSFNRTHLGIAVTYLSTTMIISTIFVRVVIKKFYANDTTGFKRISHCFYVMVGSFVTIPIIIGFMNSYVLYLAVFLPACMSKMLMDTTWTNVLSSKTTESDKGVMMGAATSMTSLAGLICPLISGLIADYISILALTFLSIIPTIFGIVLTNKMRAQEVTKKDK